MRVTIRTPFGDQIYDTDHVAILLELDENEKEVISEMGSSDSKLFSYPNDFPVEMLQDWDHQ